MSDDLGVPAPLHGDLSEWARLGMLLLNSVLTVRNGEPLSHRDLGWEWFTDRVIELISRRQPRVVFVLWGGWAQKKARLIGNEAVILRAAHPSPLSARRGFLGSRPFSQINARLASLGQPPVTWLGPCGLTDRAMG